MKPPNDDDTPTDPGADAAAPADPELVQVGEVTPTSVSLPAHTESPARRGLTPRKGHNHQAQNENECH